MNRGQSPNRLSTKRKFNNIGGIINFGDVSFGGQILLNAFGVCKCGGFSLSNLLLMLIGMAVVADSNNLISQIAQASEVTGFKSVVRNGLKAAPGAYFSIKNMFRRPPMMPPSV